MTGRAAASLTLEVAGPQADELGAQRRKVFGTDGGSIGRSADNHWVLADPYVSGRHALVGFKNGDFTIQDLDSRNGVFVNGDRVAPGSPCALKSGDRVFIEPYEMVAAISQTATSTGTPARSAKAPYGASPAAAQHRALGSDAGLLEEDSLDSPGWLNDLGPAPEGKPAATPRADAVSSNPLHDALPQPARPRAASMPLIPPDYKPLDDSGEIGPFTNVQPAQRPEPRSGTSRERRGAERRKSERPSSPDPSDGGAAQAAVAPGSADLRALLAGLGLGGASISPEVAGQLGQILRVVVEGLLEVLKSRQEIKDEFRIRHTVMQRQGNNPLKHSIDAEDALHNLLVKKNPGYLGPVAAFEDAFTDLRNHQLAMLAGVRDAFERMFAQFHPQRLEQEFSRRTPRKGGLPILQTKPDYWELYRDMVQRLAADPDASFRTLFGDEFGRAYEEQLDRLKAEATNRKRASGRGQER